SFAVLRAQPGIAALATSIARRLSAAPVSGIVPITSPVAGLVTSWVLPLSASTHLPPRNPCIRKRSGSFRLSGFERLSCMASSLGLAGFECAQRADRGPSVPLQRVWSLEQNGG